MRFYTNQHKYLLKIGYLPFHTVAFSGLFCFKRKGQDQCKTPFRPLTRCSYSVYGGRVVAPLHTPPEIGPAIIYVLSHHNGT